MEIYLYASSSSSSSTRIRLRNLSLFRPPGNHLPISLGVFLCFFSLQVFNLNFLSRKMNTIYNLISIIFVLVLSCAVSCGEPYMLQPQFCSFSYMRYRVTFSIIRHCKLPLTVRVEPKKKKDNNLGCNSLLSARVYQTSFSLLKEVKDHPVSLGMTYGYFGESLSRCWLSRPQ